MPQRQWWRRVVTYPHDQQQQQQQQHTHTKHRSCRIYSRTAWTRSGIRKMRTSLPKSLARWVMALQRRRRRRINEQCTDTGIHHQHEPGVLRRNENVLTGTLACHFQHQINRHASVGGVLLSVHRRYEYRITSLSFCLLPSQTMKMSNSSATRNGDSMASHRASMKATVVKDRSPPLSSLTSCTVCERPSASASPDLPATLMCT